MARCRGSFFMCFLFFLIFEAFLHKNHNFLTKEYVLKPWMGLGWVGWGGVGGFFIFLHVVFSIVFIINLSFYQPISMLYHDLYHDLESSRHGESFFHTPGLWTNRF